jgi:hypothetical protein
MLVSTNRAGRFSKQFECDDLFFFSSRKTLLMSGSSDGLGGASRKRQVSVDEAIAKIKVSRSRVFRSSFAQKSFSILLDTHTLREQDHVEVSPFEARLPLRSPKAVSLRSSSTSRAKRAQAARFLFSRVRPYLLSDVQVCKPKTLAVPRETLLTHYSLDASGNFEFLKKENHHVRIKQECRPSFVRRSLEQG